MVDMPQAFKENSNIVNAVQASENLFKNPILGGDCDANGENCKSWGMMQIKLLNPGEIYMWGIPAVSKEDLLDSAKNIKLGTQLLNRYSEKFNGDLDKILAAYNQGYGATRRAIKDVGPGGDWLSLLESRVRPSLEEQQVEGRKPKNDPRNYIMRVKTFLRGEVPSDVS